MADKQETLASGAMVDKKTVMAYVAEHKLGEHFQAALQHAVDTQTDDPLGEAGKFLLERSSGLSRGHWYNSIRGARAKLSALDCEVTTHRTCQPLDERILMAVGKGDIRLLNADFL